MAGASSDPILDAEEADELGELLTSLGLEDRRARVITFLAHHREARSAEIEDACDLRQPQVSQATTALEEQGWVQTGTEQTPGKGRPANVYSLAIGLDEIVEEVTARRREKINRELARIERARNLVAQATGREVADDGAAVEEPAAREHQDATN
jgi:predicted transcriptional regulator